MWGIWGEKEWWFNVATFHQQQMCSKQDQKRKTTTMLSQIKKIPQINSSEHCQWPGVQYSLLTNVFNQPTSSHGYCSLSLCSRECGKALTLPLKLVMETCFWGSEWIEPDSQSVVGNHSLVVPGQLVVIQCAWSLVGRHRLMVQMAAPGVC